MLLQTLKMAEKWNISDSDIFRIKVACIKLSKMLSNLTKILGILEKILKCLFYTSRFLDPR